MTDLVIGWSDGSGDVCVSGADLRGDDGLRSSVAVSLFTDRRVARDELPPNETDARGWWGDGLEDDPRSTGSRLWLLKREKRTSEVLSLAETYAREALEWMLTDGVATEVSVAAAYGEGGRMVIAVTIGVPDNSTREFQFEGA